MLVKNGTYVVYKNMHFKMINETDTDYELEGNCKNREVMKIAKNVESIYSDSVYFFVPKCEVDSAYELEIYVKYKGFILSVMRTIDGEEVFCSVRKDSEVAKVVELQQVGNGQFEGIIHCADESVFEKIWYVVTAVEPYSLPDSYPWNHEVVDEAHAPQKYTDPPYTGWTVGSVR